MADERADDERPSDPPAPVVVPSIWSAPPVPAGGDTASGPTERPEPVEPEPPTELLPTGPPAGAASPTGGVWDGAPPLDGAPPPAVWSKARRGPRGVPLAITLVGLALVAAICVAGVLVLHRDSGDDPKDVKAARDAYVGVCSRSGGGADVCRCEFDSLQKKWGLAHFYNVNATLAAGGQMTPEDKSFAEQAFTDCARPGS